MAKMKYNSFLIPHIKNYTLSESDMLDDIEKTAFMLNTTSTADNGENAAE